MSFSTDYSHFNKLIMQFFWISLLLALATVDGQQKFHTKSCGHSLTQGLANRIVNGYDVGYYKYPWFASLLQRALVGNIETFFCGAVLITSIHILTAAHCVERFKSITTSQLQKRLRVQLGDYNSCIPSQSRVQKFLPNRIDSHPKYTATSADLLFFDIAIITLNQRAKDFIPICLPNKGFIPARYTIEATIIGLGYLNYTTKELPCTLQETRILLHSNKQCRNLVQSIKNDTISSDFLDTVLCAGYWTGRFDACAGDSGGPLSVLGPDNRYYLEGLVSFGLGCAEPNTLGFYTNVTNLMSWVRQHIGKSELVNRPIHDNRFQWNLFDPGYYFYIASSWITSILYLLF